MTSHAPHSRCVCVSVVPAGAVRKRSPTPATLPFATTSVLDAVTPVARHLALHDRVPPLGSIHQAAPAALVALSLLRLLLFNTYWRDQGLDHQNHTFTDILQSNYVSPHQVILDADIDGFSHPDAGPALMQAAAKYPEEPPSDDDSA
jgi:hypothetical protein